ncbi:hypothetical protein BU17DRAFT_58193 [Hysterangium stoloniferum]|nr:hypothetical protein BU17DRAFT_58193 [Hysterangium stoloniferum]
MTYPSPLFDLEELVHLEQAFYDAGYAEGHAHGRIHGLIEGRALGREKGYELWEEIGFYEGFASLWAVASHKSPKSDGAVQSRTEVHIRHLLELIAQFPRVNPSPSSSESDDTALDVAGLLSKIRARYKALCSTLGVRPRLRAAAQGEEVAELQALQQSRTQKGKKVWKVNKDAGSTEMSF